MLILATTIALTTTATITSAATIFESGTLGPTGVTWQQVLDGEVRATNITPNVFTGVRFRLDLPVVTTRIGGHFLSPSSGTFFGAIVALDDENDFPNSGDLSTMDVLGTTMLTFPEPSNEVLGDLNISLFPGWYALVFGSGLFGSTGNGVATRNNTDIGLQTYIGYQPGADWFSLTDLSTFFVDHRFVVQGRIVPEPSSVVLLFLTSALSFLKRTPFETISFFRLHSPSTLLRKSKRNNYAEPPAIVEVVNH